MAHFYLVDGVDDAEVASLVVIDGAEAKHAVTVSRVRAGDSLRAGNGRGLSFEGVVREASGDRLLLDVSATSRTPPPRHRLVLAQALAKGDRDELAIQAATELGVDEVVPWSAKRSVSRWEGPKIAKGLARWQAIVREATKQSVRPWQPVVAPLATPTALAERARDSTMLVLDPTGTVRLSAVELPRDGEVIVVVGPEGGITPDELAGFTAAGATVVRLGDEVLRTSTAGPAALAALSLRLARW